MHSTIFEVKKNVCELVVIFRNMRQIYLSLLEICFYIIRISAPDIFNQVITDVDVFNEKLKICIYKWKTFKYFFSSITVVPDFRMNSATPEYF